MSAASGSSDSSLPQFLLTPEGFWARVAAYFGGQDIDFADSPEFSSAYRLRGSDEPAVRALFTPARRQVFELIRGQHAAGTDISARTSVRDDDGYVRVRP